MRFKCYKTQCWLKYLMFFMLSETLLCRTSTQYQRFYNVYYIYILIWFPYILEFKGKDKSSGMSSYKCIYIVYISQLFYILFFNPFSGSWERDFQVRGADLRLRGGASHEQRYPRGAQVLGAPHVRHELSSRGDVHAQTGQKTKFVFKVWSYLIPSPSSPE